MNISRDEAINELNEELMGINPNALGREEIERWAVALNMAIKALKEERPHGKWTVRYDTMYHFECPFCKYLHQYKDNFCPNCGADMKKEGDEK